MTYKFQPFKGSKPAASNGVEQEAEKVNSLKFIFLIILPVLNIIFGSIQIECSGCLDAFCGDCALNQSKALYEVSKLLKELESVEELYPSGRAFAVDYPLYGSAVFIDRVKVIKFHDFIILK